MNGFKNVKAYILNKGIITTDIGIENGKIIAIGNNLNIDCPFNVSKTQVVLPGFIDEHIHGAKNYDSMDGSIDGISAIANALAKEGTCAFLPTTMTQSKENIEKALTSIKNYIDCDNKNGAKVLGVHLEGPFISEKHIGAQPLEFLQNPLIESFDNYNKVSGLNIKMVSLAPEISGANELIKHLKDKNIVASAGHTHANYNDIVSAMNCGLSCITHTFNAQSPLHHREIGTVGSALLLDELYTEMICDLVHLSIPAIKLLLKNKPHNKPILITDSMRAKGLKDGISELGGQKVIVSNGEARLENGALAGSTLKMNDAIKNLVIYSNVKYIDAVDFATINPATNLGINDKYGSIEVGKYANFAVLDEEFNVKLTIREGNIIYKA